MHKGLVQSARDIFWSPKKKKLFFKPVLPDDTPIAGGFNGAIIESKFCKYCKKIIIDLNDD